MKSDKGYDDESGEGDDEEREKRDDDKSVEEDEKISEKWYDAKSEKDDEEEQKVVDVDFGGKGNEEMKKEEQNEETGKNENDEGISDNKEYGIEIPAIGHELWSKSLHYVVKTLRIDKLQVEKPINNHVDLHYVFFNKINHRECFW